MKRVFVGGSNDGERIDFEGDLVLLQLPKKNRTGFFDGDISKMPILQAEVYRRETIRSPRADNTFYVENTITVDCAIAALINGYQREKQQKSLEANILELVAQWRETVKLYQTDPKTRQAASGYLECIGELEQIVDGNLSAIEKLTGRD